MAKPDKLFNDIKKNLLSTVKQSDKNTLAAQKLIYELIASYLEKSLKTENGQILITARNFATVNNLDTFWTKEISPKLSKNWVLPLGKDMLTLAAVSKKYYKSMGFSASEIARIDSKLNVLNQAIGIDAKKRIIKGGFLDNLTKSASVKEQIKRVVTNNITRQTSITEFRKEFRATLLGRKDVDGRLQAYSRQYVHDAVFNTQAAVDGIFADELGLDYFIYEGTEIDSSRQFCIARIGKVFSRDEAETWCSDPDLPKMKGENPCGSYNYEIERGRWNCRHILRWITEDLAAEMGNEIAIMNIEQREK